MKRFLFAAALAVATVPAFAQVGVSVSIGQPGFYGRLDVGSFPAPQLLYPTPVVIQPVPVGVVRQPIYLNVPPGHAKDWGKHCYKYNACGQPVYFVRNEWYENVYAPGYRERHGGRGYDRDYDRGDRRGYDRGDDQGDRGRGHGHGHGNKHDR